MKEKVTDDCEQKTADCDGFEVMKNIEDKKVERSLVVETNTDDEDDFGIVVDNCHFMPVFDAVLLSPPWGGPSYLKSKVEF